MHIHLSSRIHSRIWQIGLAASALNWTATAADIVLWNQHNAKYGERGTRRCDVEIFKGEKSVWKKTDVELAWDLEKDEKTVVTTPLAAGAFDRVRVSITDWVKNGGGLSEIEVLEKGSPFPGIWKATASGEYDSDFPASRVVDGNRSSEVHKAGYWLLPGKSAGWVEIALDSTASPPPVAPGTAPAAARTDNGLEDVIADYEKRAAEIKAEIRPAIDAAKQKCEAEIEAIATKLNNSKKGDLAVSVRKELERLKQYGIATAPVKEMPPEVRAAYATFQRAVAQTEQSVALKRASLRTKYAQDLVAAERTLATAGDAEGIKKARRARTCLAIANAVTQGALGVSEIAGKNTVGLWADVPADGAYLTGFRVKSGTWFQFTVVKGLQPIFATAKGREMGAPRGSADGGIEVVAREGYAVGGILARSGEVIDSIQIIFMKVKPDGLSLDPADQYISEWLGGPPGKEKPKEFSSRGKLVIGLTGSNTDTVSSLGLIHLR